MRNTFESSDRSSLRTGEVESQATHAGPGFNDTPRETTSQNESGDYQTQENREFSSIIDIIQDQKSIMTTLATGASQLAPSAYVNPTSLATEANRRETMSTTYQKLTNVVETVPEVVLVTNFEPLFKPRANKLKTQSVVDKKKMTHAGNYFESQIAARALKFINAKKIVDDNKAFSARVERFTAQRKQDFENTLVTLKRLTNYLLQSSNTLERLKLALDTRNEMYLVNSADAYRQHISQYSSIRSQQLIRYLSDSVYTNIVPKFDVSDALRMVGYNEQNVRQAFSSTKVWLQSAFECYQLLTKTIGTSDASDKRSDDNPVRIVSSVSRNQTQIHQSLLDRLGELSNYVNVRPGDDERVLSLISDVYQYIDDVYASDDGVTSVSATLSDVSREYRYSRALSNQKTVQFLSERYDVSVSETRSNDHVFRSVVGNIADNVIDTSDSQKNSLASLAVTTMGEKKILVLEPFLTFNADNVISGGDHYIDSIASLSTTTFDVSRLESLSKKIYDVETSFNGVVHRMNALGLEYSDDQSYEEGRFVSKVSNPASLFTELTSLFLTDDHKMKSEIRDDVSSCVFVAAHRDVALRSLLFLYVLPESSGNNNPTTIKKIVDRAFDVLHSNARNELLESDSLLRSAFIRERATPQNVSRAELTDAFLRQSSVCSVVSTFMQKYVDALRTSGAVNSSGRMRYGGDYDTCLLMKLFDSIVDVFSNISNKAFTGYTQIDNDEYLTVGSRSRDAKSFVNATLDSIKFEQSILHHFVLSITSTLSKFRKVVNDVSSYFSSGDTSSELKNLLKAAGHDVLADMLFNKNQTRIIASIVEDMSSALGVIDKRTVFDADDDGDFDLDDQIRILDDSVITSKMKAALYGVFSLDEFTLENMNAKIFSIGIPPGLTDELRRRSNVKKGKKAGLLTKQNDIITINVYKVDQKNPDIVWKPKKFLFEMSRFPVRNNRLLNIRRFGDIDSIISGIPTRDYSPHNSTPAVQYFKSDIPGSSYADDNTYVILGKKDALAMYKNHVYSYALELYVRLMTGLSLAEHEFTVADDVTSVDIEYVSELATSDVNRQNTTREQRTDRTSSQGGSLFRRARATNRTPSSTSSMSDSNLREENGSGGGFSVTEYSDRQQTSQVTPIQIKPLGVALAQINENNQQLVFYRTSSLHELSRMLTPQTSTVFLTRKLLTPKVFDRTFNVLIDSNSYEVDVDKTVSTPHGKNALDSLIKSGELVAAKKQTVERSTVRFAEELKEYSHVKGNSTNSDLVFDKYFVTIELYGVSQ